MSGTQTGWRARMKEIGKDAFIREEMIRLGFWPPDQETADRAAQAEIELKEIYDGLAGLRSELRGVEAQVAEAGDIPRLLAEIRRQRIERVRQAREERRVRRAQEREERQAQDREWRRKTLPFLGRGVSAGLRYEGGDAARTAGLGLPALASASDLAAAIGITERELAWLTYHRGAAAADHYHRFTIPKRRGGERVISSPKTRLRVAQGWLLRNVLAPLPMHEAAMAFRPGRSIRDNAARHAGRAVVIKMDLKDFFPSITFRRVKKLFESFGYNEGIASLLGLLATEAPRVAVTAGGEKRFVALGERCLPQGACTSPGVTNLLCRRLDARLTGAAQSLGFVYTRYADDLVFSHESRDAPIGALMTLVREIIAHESLTINEEKTRIMRPQHRQAVTGVVVNEAGTRVSRHDLRRFRAFLHQFEAHGAAEMSRRLGQDALAYASGYLSFIHMVNPDQAEKIRQRHSWLVRYAAGKADEV